MSLDYDLGVSLDYDLGVSLDYDLGVSLDCDLGVSLLRDLQALAERQDDSPAFRERFGELRARHVRKPSLVDRFDRAGLSSSRDRPGLSRRAGLLRRQG